MNIKCFGDSYDSGDEVPQNFKLLNKGVNKFTLNGKQSEFVLDDDDIKEICEEFKQRDKDLVIDFDHSTLDKKASATGDAPAAGWCVIEPDEEGLKCVIKNWTKKGEERLRNKEYRYFSPVIQFDPETRRPRSIQSIGLTNHPAIHSSMPLVAANDLMESNLPHLENDLDMSDVIDGYKILAKQLKDGIGGLQGEMKRVIHAMNDASKGFPDIESDVKSFCDTMFKSDLKALNDLIGFSDMATVQQEYYAITGNVPINEINDPDKLDSIAAWIKEQEGKIERENATLTPGVDDAIIQENKDILAWLDQKATEVAARQTELKSMDGNEDQIVRDVVTNKGLQPPAFSDTQKPVAIMLDMVKGDKSSVLDDIKEYLGSVPPEQKEDVIRAIVDVLNQVIADSDIEITEEEYETFSDNWVAKVKPEWEPPEGFFDKSAKEIAKNLKDISEDYRQAMARLTFYINRKGKALTDEEQGRLENAKSELRKVYGREPDGTKEMSDMIESLNKFSDISLTEGSTTQDIINNVKGLNDFKDETVKAFNDIGVKNVNELIEKFNDLEAEKKNIEAEMVVERVMSEQPGKITEGMKPWAVEFAKRDLKGFNDYVAESPVMFKSNKSAKEINKPARKEYSTLAMDIANQMGHNPEDVYSK